MLWMLAATANLASNRMSFLRISAQQPECEALRRATTLEPTVVAEVL